MKTVYRWFTFIMLAVMLLAACAPAAATTIANTPKARQPIQRRESDLQPVDFRRRRGFSAQTERKVSRRNIPNITLEITEIPEVGLCHQNRHGPGGREHHRILLLSTKHRWMKAGKFLPIDEMVAKYNIQLADFNQGIVKDTCTVNGKLYCLGTYTGAVLLFYNKDMFDAAGVAYPSATVPMSIDEYAAVAAKLTKPNEDIKRRGSTADRPGRATGGSTRHTRFSSDGRKIRRFI